MFSIVKTNMLTRVSTKVFMVIACLSLGLYWVLRPSLLTLSNNSQEAEATAAASTYSSIIQKQIIDDQYGRTTRKQGAESEATCTATFGKTLEENIEKIKSYNLSEADKYFYDIDLPSPKTEIIFKGAKSSDIEIPTVLTGASGNHYLESLEMLESLNTVVRSEYRNLQVFYYDLGLEPKQLEEVKMRCNCTVLTFPFEKFPPHVRRLKGYCWKPLAIKMMLQIRPFVMWMDASIQFQKSDLDQLFMQAKQYGIMMYHNVWTFPAHVHQDTFNFLQEPPCLYQNFTEYHAGLILLHRGHNTVKNYVIDPWVKCALIEECMKTKHEEKDLLRCQSHKIFHSCHRFDQAVVSLLIFRLFHDSFKNHAIDHKYFRICYDQSCRKKS